MKKRIRRLMKLWLFVSAFSLVLSLVSLFVLYELAENGVPRFAMEYFFKRMAANGIRVHADRCRISLTSGVTLDNLEISTPELFESPSAKFKKANIRPSLTELFSGSFLPFRIKINGGELAIPLFPEYGGEGAADVLRVSELVLDAGGSPGFVTIKRLDGKLNSLEFTFSGRAENMLHTLAGFAGGMFQRKMRGHASPGGAAAGGLQAENVIASIPLEMRRNAARFIYAFEGRKFKTPPRFDAHFFLDFNNLKKTTIEAVLSLPALKYGRLDIGSITEKIVVKNGAAEFNSLFIELGSGEYITADCGYDILKDRAAGRFSGVCTPAKMMLMLDSATRENILSKISLEMDSPITFRGDLYEFSLSDGSFKGLIELNLPSLVFNGITLRDIATSVKLVNGAISGKVDKAALGSKHSLSGEFKMSNNSFEATVKGSAPHEIPRRFLSKEALELVNAYFKFKDGADVSFSGSIRSNDWDSGGFDGELTFKTAGVDCWGLTLESISATLGFTPDTLDIREMKALADGSMNISGQAVCRLSEKTLDLSFLCRGAPGRAVKMLEQSNKMFVEGILHRLKLPKKGSLMEIAADVRLDYGKKRPFCRAGGSIALAGFKFMDVDFDYGSAQFIFDSSQMILLPRVELRNRGGSAFVSACFHGLGESVKHPAGANSNSNPDGTLDFMIESSLVGNEMMKILYPEWKSKIFDFPEPLIVRANGLIDYNNDADTEFKAWITNGSCLWKKIRLEDIDATLTYSSEKLKIAKSLLRVCGGQMDFDYSFDFKNMTGEIKLNLENADFARVAGYVPLKNYKMDSVKARISGSMNSAISYPGGGDELHMSGSGKIDVRGTNLWTIPVFGELLKYMGRAWHLDAFGNITKIDGTFTLDRTMVANASVKSNGSLVAIRGRGSYDWEKDEIDARIRSELLRDALPFSTVSTMLYPISWTFEKHLKGKLGAHTWEDQKNDPRPDAARKNQDGARENSVRP